MSHTELVWKVMYFHRLHHYDAYANPDEVGLGRCRCGVDMYYSSHESHFAEELVVELKTGFSEELVARLKKDGWI